MSELLDNQVDTQNEILKIINLRLTQPLVKVAMLEENTTAAHNERRTL